MKINTFILFIIFILFFCSSTSAQFNVKNRYEFALEGFSSEEYEVISLKNKGLLIYNITKPNQYAKLKEFNFHLLDTTLTLIKSQTHSIPQIFTQNRLSYYDEADSFFFFSQDDLSKLVHIFRMNMNLQTYELHEVKLPLRLDVQDFKVVGEDVYITGLFERKSVALIYNLIEKLPKVLPSFFEEREEIKIVQTDSQNNQIHFIMGGLDNRDCKLFIKPYSNLVGSRKRLEVKGKERELRKKTFKDARIFSPSTNNKLVIGTYSINCANSYQGLFVAKFENDEQQSINFSRFTDFGNFFNHYNERKASKIGNRVEKYNTKGKDYILNYKLKMQEKPIETDKEIIICLESYYSQYQNNPTTLNPSSPLYANQMGYYNRYGFNQFPTTQQGRLNRFTYSVVCGFDKKGRLLWDNVMKIEDVEQAKMNDILRIGNMGDSTILTYLKKDEVYSKLIYRYQNVQKEEMQTLKDIFVGIKTNDTDDTELIHWYDNYFLLFGEQRLRNISEGDNAGKRVFHVTKIGYQFQKKELTDEKIRKKTTKKQANTKKEKKK